MMRTLIAGLALTSLLLAAACEATEPADETATEEAAEGATEAPEAGDDDGALPEGAAASVDGETIPAAEIDERVDAALSADEELAAQIEEAGEPLLAEFRAQALSTLIYSRVILDGASELGADPTEDDVAATRGELVDELGGEEAFDSALAQSGMSEQALDEQIRSLAALDRIGERLVEQGAGDDVAEDGGAPEAVLAQQWLTERIGAASIRVHSAYGYWDASAGQVVTTPPEAPAGPDDDGQD